MISIHEWPKEVEDSIIPGHWEGNLNMGKSPQECTWHCSGKYHKNRHHGTLENKRRRISQKNICQRTKNIAQQNDEVNDL